MAFTKRSTCDNLSDILRRANLHYSALAKALKSSLRPTHHAKKRAFALQLSVSIQAAARLDPRQISVLPPPVLDLTQSPPPIVACNTALQSCETVTILAPKPLYPSQADIEEGEYIQRPVRPALRCVIPSQQANASLSVDPAHFLSNGWENMTSKWSATTIGESGNSPLPVHAEAMNTDEYDIVDALEDAPDMIHPALFKSPLDCEDEVFDSLRPRVSVSGSARPRISVAPPLAQPRCSTSEAASGQPRSSAFPPRLDVPIDIGRFSWSSDLFLGPRSGSSRSSSLGPITPQTPEVVLRSTISSKRKCSPCEGTDDDRNAPSVILEKRPRFERKPWVVPSTHRRENSRTTLRRRF